MSKFFFDRRLINAFTMFVVTVLSLSLLLYVGYGEGKRTYEQIQIEKLIAQGKLVQSSIEKFLRDGLPLKQYPGFATLAAPIVDSQEEVDAIAVHDQSGRQLFVVVDKSKPVLPPPSSAITRVRKDIEIDYGDTHYQVVVPLRTRFETVGAIVIMSKTDFVARRLRTDFLPLLFVAAGLAATFAIAIAFAAPYLRRTRVPWLQVGYGVTFMMMAGVVVFTLIVLYFDGVKGKIQTSAYTFSQRLNDIFAFDLNINDFDGLDKVFRDYRRLNAEVTEAALIVDSHVEIATDNSKIHKTWVTNPRDYEFKVDLSQPNQTGRVRVAVTVPRHIVLERVVRSVKNFAALFIASAFLAGLFLQVALSLQAERSLNVSPSDPGSVPGDSALVILKPIFFLAVFLDSMTYSFLPKFMQDAAVASGMSLGFAAVPFTAYYLLFALSLIPAGNIADRYGPTPVIVTGLMLAGASVLGLAMPVGIMEMVGLRALSGAGQGMVLIGVQNYILAVASPEKKTQGTAIIVLGFQGGMLSGMAIGSLLVNFLHPPGVFTIAGVVGAAATLYTLALLPRLAERKQVVTGMRAAARRLVADLKTVVTNGDFLKTIFLIGIPAKAILTGVITFALPLILIKQEYRSEDIGQVVMLYGLAVVVSTGLVSRLVDRTHNTESVLFWGAVASGTGLIMVGLTGSYFLDNGLLSTAVVVTGVILVGLAHGCINAPVVTHVGQSALACRVGANPVTTTYRFLERGGHIAGPFVVSQLFLFWGQGPYVIGWIGTATAAMGLLFVARKLTPRLRSTEAETARS